MSRRSGRNKHHLNQTNFTMENQDIILVTGANTGLGFEIVKALCSSSQAYQIILGVRSLPKAKDAVKRAQTEFPSSKSTLSAVQVDIEDDDSIQRAYETLQSNFGRLDVLINNAGAQLDQRLAAGTMTTREMWNKSWDINTTGTYILTHSLIPLLLKSSNPRLLFITSGTSTLAESDNLAIPVNRSPPKGWPKTAANISAYRSAKCGMNMMMREWVRILKEDDVKVWCISPGYLATGLGGSQQANLDAGALDPAIGGNFVKDVVEGRRDADVGKVVHFSGRVQPW